MQTDLKRIKRLRTPFGTRPRPLAAYDNALARGRKIERALDHLAREPVRIEAARPALFAAVTAFDGPVAQEVEEILRTQPAYKAHVETLERAAEAVYRDPAAAVARIRDAVRGGQAENELAAVLQREANVAGELRGSRHLLDGLSARAERRKADAAVTRLAVAVRYFGESWRVGTKAETERVKERRARMGTGVPALSPEALTQLERMEKLRLADPA